MLIDRIKYYAGILKRISWREIEILLSRPVYLLGIVVAPLVCCALFLPLMRSGLPQRIPTGIVDLDKSVTSRNLVRNLNSLETLEVVSQPNSFTEAREAVQKGVIFGFLIIPEGFEAKALSGRQPEISYYTNNAYFIPGALLFKGFKTMTILSSGQVTLQTKLAKGEYEYQIMPQLQPVSYDAVALGNPWLNYSIYLNNSLLPGMLHLMVLLMTCFCIGQEVKRRTAREWLAESGNSIILAITGKLLPQTLLFSLTGTFCLSLMYGYMKFPHANGFLPMIAAMVMMVVAAQSVGVIIMSFVPSLRVGLSVAGLYGVLSLSLAGFTFPTEAMYEPLRIFSEIIPLRHYFLIYSGQALNGIPFHYSILQYFYLFTFFAASLPLLKRLKLAVLRQNYVP